MKKSLISFCFSFFLHSSLAFFESTKSVVHLTDKDFSSKVLYSPHIWIIKFYAPWCGHCKSLAPEFQNAAEKLDGIVKFGAVDCDAERGLCSKYQIRGYPSVKVFPADQKGSQKVPIDYEGERRSKKIRDFVLSRLPRKHIKTISNEKDLDSFLKDSKPKVILFSNKDSIPPIYKSLSIDVKDEIALGVVLSGKKDLMNKFKVTDLPKILSVDNDGLVLEEYEGEYKMNNILKFLKNLDSVHGDRTEL